MASSSFLTAYRAWRALPFPRGSKAAAEQLQGLDLDQFLDLHGELVHADADVADMAIHFSEGRPVTIFPIALARVDDILRKCLALKTRHVDADGLVDKYLAYAEALKAVADALQKDHQ